MVSTMAVLVEKKLKLDHDAINGIINGYLFKGHRGHWHIGYYNLFARQPKVGIKLYKIRALTSY